MLWIFLDAVQPCTKLVKFGADVPSFKGFFIAPTATVVGKVSIGSNSSVWYGAVIRGAFFSHLKKIIN